MAKCSNLIGPGVIGQQCELDTDHDGPHVSQSNAASVAARTKWEVESGAVETPEAAQSALQEFHDPPQTFAELRGELKGGEVQERVHPAERTRLEKEAKAEEARLAYEEAVADAAEAAEAVIEEEKEDKPAPGTTEEKREPFPGSLAGHVEDDTVDPADISPQPDEALIGEGVNLLLNGVDGLLTKTRLAAQNMRAAKGLCVLETELSASDQESIGQLFNVLVATADALDGGRGN